MVRVAVAHDRIEDIKPGLGQHIPPDILIADQPGELLGADTHVLPEAPLQLPRADVQAAAQGRCHHSMLYFFAGNAEDFVKIMFDKRKKTLYNI